MIKYGRNELKLKILSFIRDNPGVTTFDISNALDLDYNLVTTSIYYYRIQALVRRDRERIGGRLRYVYSLTDRGKRKIEYLSSVLSEQGESIGKKNNLKSDIYADGNGRYQGENQEEDIQRD